MDLSHIAEKAAQLQELIEAGLQPGRIAQLEESLRNDVIQFGRSINEAKMEEKMKTIRADMFLMAQEMQNLRTDNARLREFVKDTDTRIMELESKVSQLSASIPRPSPRADVEPPRRPTMNSASSVQPSLHRRSTAPPNPDSLRTHSKTVV